MTENFRQALLGRTGLRVGRLGMAASYGAPAEAFEEAFDKGCNYFYIGSGRRRSGMKKAILNLVAAGHRDKMVIAVQTYARFGVMTEILFKQTLKSLNIDHADALILGWHNRAPFGSLENFAARMKEKGLCRFVGMSGHNRALFGNLAKKNFYDLFHVRYNPAHRGAETEVFPALDLPGGPGIVSYTATRWGHLLDAKNMPKGQMALKASDCYRFVLSNPSVDVCMCGPRNINQMRGALEALKLGPLSDEEMQKIKTVGDHVHQTVGGFFSF
jgi:predicted aldo/keto reductase-like oxidoreductase